MSRPKSINQIRKRQGKQLPPRLNAKEKLVSGTLFRADAHFAAMCGIRHCAEEGGFHGTPMCKTHAWQVWATLDAVKGYEEDKQREYQHFLDLEEQWAREDAEKQAEREATWKSRRWIEPGYVYFLLVGDRIKIGYTKDLEQRLKQYPPTSVLLAQHPGTPKLERETHHKFLLHLANGREWFRIEQPVLDHIDKVRKQFKQEHLGEMPKAKQDSRVTAQ